MKQFLFLFMASTFFFGCKKVKNANALVIRDCTGTYVRHDEKDYKVCNSSVLDSYATNIEIQVTFEKLKECKGDTGAVCMMAHQFEDWVEIKSIE